MFKHRILVSVRILVLEPTSKRFLISLHGLLKFGLRLRVVAEVLATRHQMREEHEIALAAVERVLTPDAQRKGR